MGTGDDLEQSLIIGALEFFFVARTGGKRNMHPEIVALLTKIHHAELLQSLKEERLAQLATRSTTVLPPWPQKLHRALFALRLRRKSRRHRLAKRTFPHAWQDEIRSLID